MSSPQPASARASIRGLLVRQALVSAVIGLVVFTTILLVLVHQGVHADIDGVLIRAASQLATGTLEAGCLPGVAPVSLYALSSAVVTPDGATHAMTPDLEDWVVPSDWLSPDALPDPKLVDVVLPRGQELLWAAVVAMPCATGRTIAVVGLPHDDVDQSIWSSMRRALVPALLVIVLAGVGAAVMARRLTRDLEALSEECRRAGQSAPSDLPAGAFAVSADAPEEVALLGATMRRLTAAWRAMADSQSVFLAEAAHELRTPLTALRGELELALRRPRSHDEYRETIEDALHDTNRLAELAEWLLEAAREQGRDILVESVDAAQAVMASLTRFDTALDDCRIRVISEIPSAPVLALADIRALGTALDNLVANTLAHANASRLFATVRTADDNSDQIEIWLADDGQGIDEALRAHVFTPFVTGETTRGGPWGGHGLGLHIARTATERQSGHLDYVVRTEDRPAALAGATGAAWRIRLPRAK